MRQETGVRPNGEALDAAGQEEAVLHVTDTRSLADEARAAASSPPPGDDYERVRRIIAFMTERWREQPTAERIADHVGISTTHMHHLFRRWCGLTPKDFLAALTIDHARILLAGSANVLDTAFEVGLSGPGRLHDLFVTHEAMSPGEYKARGAGLLMRYGYHPSPFGEAILVATDRGLAGLGFVDDGDQDGALADMRRRWPGATLNRDDAGTAALAARIFDPGAWSADTPLRVVMIGSDFELRVWQTLLRVPLGRATTYATIAASIGSPKASRAVGAAVGRNPVSFVVPCHRVLGSSGAITGYHWGLTRKQAMLGWELGRLSG